MSVFGPSISGLAPSPGGWLVESPPSPFTRSTAYDSRDEDNDPLIEWCRNASAVLKREKQPVTEEMTRSLSLYRGGTPWWRNRPKWKLGKKFPLVTTIPIQWASILSDNRPRVTYGAYRVQDQRIADIATAAFDQAYTEGFWQGKVRNAILGSRVVKKNFLRLVPEMYGPGGEVRANLVVVSGLQVYADDNATCIDDAEVVMYEYRESPNKVFARWPKLRQKIVAKRNEQGGYDETSGEVLSPPTQMAMPTGGTVNNPPFAATANPPDNAGGTAGIVVREFWTRPRKKIPVEKVLFTVAGEPAVQTKRVEYEDGTSEVVKRIITEGNVVYEWPQSYVDVVRDAELWGGLRILWEAEAVEVIKHKVDYPLYPEGRLVITVDEEFNAEDRMNPLGYFPFIEIEAYPDPEKFWGLSDIDLIADGYEYYIRLISLMYDAANLTSNPIWRLPLGDEMADEDITNAPGAIQRETMQSLRYGKREPGPDMPQYVMQLLQYVKGEIREISGLNEIASGQAKFKGQQSAETVSMYQEAAGVRFNDALHRIEEAMVKLGEQFLELMTRYYTTPHLVQLKNDAGVMDSIPLLGSYFTAPLRVESKPGSSRTPSQKFNMALNLLSTGRTLVTMPDILKQLQELGLIDSASATERRIMEALKNPGDPTKSWLVTGQLPGQTNPGSTPKKPGSKRKSSQAA